MSSSARVVVLVVSLTAFIGSVFLVVLDPSQIGSWFAAVAMACVIAATVADMRSSAPPSGASHTPKSAPRKRSSRR